MSDSSLRTPTPLQTPIQTPRQTPSNSIDSSMNIDNLTTPPPPARSNQPPPAPRKAIKFNQEIRRIIDADKTIEQKIRLTQNLDIPDELKREILKYLKSDSGLARLKLIFSPDDPPSRDTPSPHDPPSPSSFGLVRGGKKVGGRKVGGRKLGGRKKKVLKKSLKKRSASKKKKLTRGGKKR
tara:strand:+ start:6404 stop:6946 length:543 start_codon:yes stop_codon:yes gene_type:complete